MRSNHSFACCALWQYHRPGKSHQEEFGFPEWGDKPTKVNVQASHDHQTTFLLKMNTVVMWRDNPMNETGKDEQALFTHHSICGLVNMTSAI